MKKIQELTIEQNVVIDCPILFRMYGRSCSETCLAFGFECKEGWHRVIDKYARQMEMLNIEFYPKYRARIQADQIKEKFGELRFYYSVVVDPNAFAVWTSHVFRDWSDAINNKYYKLFKYVKVVDVEPYDYDETDELTKEQYEKCISSKSKPSNVDYVEKDGKFFEIVHLRNYGKSHSEPTEHKFMWKIMKAFDKFSRWFESFPKKDNWKVRNCIKTMDEIAEDLVKKAEEECAHTCENCGRQIGTDWSPVCTTTGWITNICDECAKKTNNNYWKNGELWNGDKCIKPKQTDEKHT